ncbi:hypothetical protein WG66_010055 [Moniliophthora roreri]|nr:hypothetical protein WG66_010055 [Moniliophthora roreri]
MAANAQSSSSGIGGGAIAGIVIGVFGAIGIGMLVGILLFRRRVTQNSTVQLDSPAVKESSWPPVEPYTYTSYSSPQSESGVSSSPSPSQLAFARGMKGEGSHFVTNDTTSYGSRPISSSNLMDRHTDGGPTPGATLSRQESGRLPPAYGDLRQ